jgi:hypothetical protein
MAVMDIQMGIPPAIIAHAGARQHPPPLNAL